MVVKFYMPGEEGASLEQLAYGMVEKIARQTTSLDQVKFGRTNSAIKGLKSPRIKPMYDPFWYFFILIFLNLRLTASLLISTCSSNRI